MATTMSKDTTNGKWKLTETASAAQTYNKTIKCGGTYMEYDVDVSVTTKAGSAHTPATSITANPTISVAANGTITANVSKSQSITPTVAAGYVASGTAGSVTVSGSTEQNLPVKAATTYTPTTTDQTITGSNSSSSGFFVTGVQKILGDANLVPGNIKAGISIFGVEGTYAQLPLPDDANVSNAAVTQILEGYEAYDKNGTTLTGTMPDLTGIDITSSATAGKTMTLTLNQAGTLYTIKMYAGSTGYVVNNSSFITDTVAKSTISGHTSKQNEVYYTGANVSDDSDNRKEIVISAGYYNVDRVISIANVRLGVVKTPATTITVTPTVGAYETNKGYPINVSATQSVVPNVGKSGYIEPSGGVANDYVQAGTITVQDDDLTYLAQSTLSTNSVTPSTSGAQTVTIGAGYYPSSRTVTVGAVTVGSITLTSSATSSIVMTDGNNASVTIGQSAQPSGTNYIKLTPSTTSTSSCTFSAGYIASAPTDATVANQAGTAVYLNVYDGTIE